MTIESHSTHLLHGVVEPHHAGEEMTPGPTQKALEGRDWSVVSNISLFGHYYLDLFRMIIPDTSFF